MPLAQPSVLIVEDDTGLADLYLHTLRECGIDCHVATTAAECHAYLRQQRPDLLLLDYSLPDQPALTLVDQLAEAHRLPPFIVVTGHGDERVAVQAMKRGARDYLIKDSQLLDRLTGAVTRTLLELATERRLLETEQSLRENQSELEAIYDHTPVMLFVLDDQSRVLRLNRAASRFAGSTAQQAVGLAPGNVLRCIHAANDSGGCGHGAQCNACTIRNTVLDTLTTGTSHENVEQTLTTGAPPHTTHHHFRLSSSRIDVRGNIRLLVCLEDLSERHRTELALRDSERLYHSLVENLPQYIFRKDLDGRFTFANQRFCQLLGRDLQDVLGRTDNDLFSPRLAAQYRADDQRIMVQDCSAETEEEHQSPLLSHRLVRVNKSPLHDASGRVIGIQGIFWDVTEQRRLEEQLRQAQKMEAIGHLAGGIAHDFNNILAAVTLQLGLMKTSTTLDSENVEMVGELETEVKRAANLTRQLLLFGRRSTLQPRVLDLNELTENLLKMLRRLIGENIELRFTSRSRMPPVSADPGMLEQVLMNLTVNARDAMPKGGCITIASETTRFTPDTVDTHPDRRAGDFVRLSVTDEGCGMDQNTLERIFEPFFTTKEVGKGTGLGLATVYGIIKQHQGWIEVESTPGRGSSFHIHLPAHASPLSTPHIDPAHASVRHGSETILLVEDESSVRRTVGQCLRMLGYSVLEAANGHEALDLWQKHNHQIDLLFSDMIMPGGMTGADLAESLRRENPNLKVILSSGYSAETARSDATPHPHICHLAKPYDATALGDTIRAVLDGTQPDTRHHPHRHTASPVHPTPQPPPATP